MSLFDEVSRQRRDIVCSEFIREAGGYDVAGAWYEWRVMLHELNEGKASHAMVADARDRLDMAIARLQQDIRIVGGNARRGLGIGRRPEPLPPLPVQCDDDDDCDYDD